MDLNCKLPYNKDNLFEINNIYDITGKNLNKPILELYENDKTILDKLNYFYNNYKELTGDNVNGLITHLMDLEKIINELKDLDDLIAKDKYDFLVKNDCNIPVESIYPCKDIKSCEILGFDENIAIHYLEKNMNEKVNCKDCFDVIECSETFDEELNIYK